MQRKPVMPDYESYCRDESRLGGTAREIAFPENARQLAEVLAAAAKEKLKVTVQGARTGLAGGAVPEGGLIISTQNMNAILGLRQEAGVYYLRVQGGVTLEDVHAFLRRPKPGDNWTDEAKSLCEEMGSGQRFTPNPTETTATMGGLFASNAKGTNSLGYGGVGSYVNSLLWADAGGSLREITRGEYVFDQKGCTLPGGSYMTVADTPKGGLPLLYPVQGMDLVDLLAGSEGRAGIIAELELRLEPEPAESWGIVYFFDTDAAALGFAAELANWRVQEENTAMLSAVEYYDGATLEMVRRERENMAALKTMAELPTAAGAALYVVLQGEDPETLELALGEHLELFEAAGGRDEDSWAAMGSAEMEVFDTLRHGVPEMINVQVDALRLECGAIHKTATDFEGPGQRGAEYCEMYHRDIAGSGVEGFVFGHILENRLHVNLLPRNEAEQQTCHQMMQDWARRVLEDGGLIAGESGVGRLRLPLYGEIIPESRKKQLSETLRILDPEGCFSGDWEAVL